VTLKWSLLKSPQVRKDSTLGGTCLEGASGREKRALREQGRREVGEKHSLHDRPLVLIPHDGFKPLTLKRHIFERIEDFP